MRVTLFHNDHAGDELYETRELASLFRDAGYAVDAFDAKAVKVSDIVRSGPAVIVAAGGDGTIAKVAIAIHESGANVPMFLLPLGTSNNIARSFEIDQTVPSLIRALPHARSARLDVGMVRAPWGNAFFIEATGVGFIGTMLEGHLSPLDLIARVGRNVRNMLPSKRWRRDPTSHGVARLVRKQPVTYYRVIADAEDLSGEYLAVELMNIRQIGPRVRLAPTADPGDQQFDLVLVRSEDRDALSDYIANGHQASSGPPGIARRVRRAEMSWPFSGGHVDDEPWSPRVAHREAYAHESANAVIGIAGSIEILLPPLSHVPIAK